MGEGRFPALFNHFLSHPRRVAAGVALLVLLSAAGLLFIPFRHSMEVMLPSGSDTQKAVGFLQDIDFSAKVAVSFSLKEGGADPAGLFAAVDGFVDSLEPPMITQVLSTVDEQQMIRDIGVFLERAPELLGPGGLAELEKNTTREGVAKSLRKKYVQLLKPEGSFMAAMIQRDPLDIQMAMIEKIRALSSSFGYDMRIEKGHLVSADGKQVLLVLETDIPFTDAGGSHALVGYLTERMEALPPAIDAEMVCGHLHTISNEKVIRHDISLTVTIASVAFVLLFLLFFRDLRANLIFIVPFAALLVAVNLAALLLGTLSPMMLGFGSVVSGIAVDYGIHVYVAVRRSSSALEAVRSVAKPIMLGALTTAGVFAAFYSSTIPGYHQLATFALLSVVFSVLGALFILPVYLKPRKNAGNAKHTQSQSNLCVPCALSRLNNPYVILAAFIVLLAAAVPVALQVEFDSDIMGLDGTERHIIETEQRFAESFGGGSAGQAVAVVADADYEKALAKNDRVYDALPDRLASFSAIWKSHANRRANAENWNAFWSEAKVANLKTLFAEEGEPYGFAVDAFEPFFQSLELPEVDPADPKDNVLFGQLKQRFVATVDGETRVFSFFPDEPELIQALAGLEDVLLISRTAISESLAEDYTREFGRITLVALGLVLLMSAILLKNVRKVLIVLAPAAAGVASVAALVRLVGTELNVMNLVSGIIVIGLCVDYGIFKVHAFTHSLNLGTRTAISLSAGTTLIGAGALLFTMHPALFAVGLTLVGGISAGYATSMLVVPALCSLFLQEKQA
ncbi:hypothetical protein PDESU_00587 [Pontiella desulfatans]|uniref:SSD domain-containing protein n=1 Tax=Pontiella desulfatans TaxID=2750659 RepID=A0A6C2TWJ3_PONDE|nr:MMPL family transporter [Pontiella desulfatans]VGO12038.1 hypothetical protein PDESU_00587 [Pontiella desulfatans]